MSPLLLKGLISAGTASVVGLSGWGIFKFLKPNTIGEQLVSEGDMFPAFVDDSDLTKWRDLAKRYKSNTESSDLRFSNLSIAGDSPTDDEARKLRDECKKLVIKELGQPDYEQDVKKLRKWCVVAPSPNIPSATSGK